MLRGENIVKSNFVGFAQNNYLMIDFVQLDFDARFNKQGFKNVLHFLSLQMVFFLSDPSQVILAHYKRWPRLMHLQTQDFEEVGGGKY